MADAAIKDKLSSLPPVPLVASEILRVLNDHSASLLEVSKSLSQEPGLTARIVALANSAFFARQSPVYSVDDAVVRLGMKRVKVLATSILLSSQLDTARCPAFDAEVYWYDAVRVAFCANRLAPYVPVEVPTDATYLAGLLHNFGIMIIACAFPEDYNKALETLASDDERALCDIETELLGFNHHLAGGMLLEEWNMPTPITTVVKHLMDAEYSGPYARFSRMIRACVDWSKKDFEGLPESAETRGVPERTLSIISNSCRAEAEQLHEFAATLSRATSE